MASSSIQTSSSSRTKIFDVFVSFRGTDTRNGFTDHLFAALQRKGVVAFRDDHKIRKGELLEPELLQAIEGSRVFIVVFSKDYASSTWCLKELTKIVDWVDQTGRSVLPVFYDVTPSEVRKQTGKFGEAFAEHEERFKDDLEMVIKWRGALNAIADRSGWDIQNRPQHGEIEKIVEEITNILCHNRIFSFGDDFVDMHSRVKQLEELVNLGTNEIVRVVGICGMGGIGKTTISTALYNKISPQYDVCCFIDDVSKIYKNFGPTSVQKQLLCQALNQGNIEINNAPQGTMMVTTRLCNLKALIVLDNVDHVEQLEKLALHPKYLGAGSVVIIISRDSHILRNYGVSEVYNVQLLNKNKALQLLCKKAFKSDDIVEEYKDLTYDVLKYVNGLPLAIKVLGSFLFGRDISEWRSALAKQKENPSKDIMDILRISYDGLEEMEKEIFLDIACLFSNGRCIRSIWELERLLEYRGFYPKIGMKVLIEKSLISCNNQLIGMHDLLKELGMSIVREKSPKEPRKWNRLWDRKDLHNIMIKNKEAKNLEAMVIEQYPEEFLKPALPVNVLSKMNQMKFLILENVSFSGMLNYLSNELSYLRWDKYPSKCLPSSFHPEELVELILPYSNIKQLWEGTKCLPNLRTLDLSHSKNLIEIPDLEGAPHLERLDLEGCVEIVRIDPSIGILREMAHLNFKNCINLVLNLNIIFGLRSLRSLNLSGCSKLLNSKLLKNSTETEHLEKIETNRSAIQLSTSSVYGILMLPFYFLYSQKHEGSSLGLLLPYMSRFPSLYSLDLSFCNLFQIPDAIGNLYSLARLNLGGNKFVTLPTTIKELSKLRFLNLEYCKQLRLLPELPTIKEKTSGKYSCIELYIFDGPKLSEMEHCYSMVYYWMMQNLQVYLQPSISLGQMNIVIPGSKIPKWFNKQNVGNSISMDPSPVMDDPNWIGVACCVSFVTHDDPTNLDHGWYPADDQCFLFCVQNEQYKNWIGAHTMLPILFKKDLVTVELDHLFTVIYSRKRFIQILSEDLNSMHDLEKTKFETFVYKPEGLNVEVKNCGYRWVFKEDLQQLNPDMMFSRNSSSTKQNCLRSY